MHHVAQVADHVDDGVHKVGSSEIAAALLPPEPLSSWRPSPRQGASRMMRQVPRRHDGVWRPGRRALTPQNLEETRAAWLILLPQVASVHTLGSLTRRPTGLGLCCGTIGGHGRGMTGDRA